MLVNRYKQIRENETYLIYVALDCKSCNGKGDHGIRVFKGGEILIDCPCLFRVPKDEEVFNKNRWHYEAKLSHQFDDSLPESTPDKKLSEREKDESVGPLMPNHLQTMTLRLLSEGKIDTEILEALKSFCKKPKLVLFFAKKKLAKEDKKIDPQDQNQTSAESSRAPEESQEGEQATPFIIQENDKSNTIIPQ